jgi:hypothetical protein
MRTQRLLFGSLFFIYWAVRRVFELLVLVGRSDREKEIEILLLRHELQVLSRADRSPTPASGRSRGAGGAHSGSAASSAVGGTSGSTASWSGSASLLVALLTENS